MLSNYSAWEDSSFDCENFPKCVEICDILSTYWIIAARVNFVKQKIQVLWKDKMIGLSEEKISFL